MAGPEIKQFDNRDDVRLFVDRRPPGLPPGSARGVLVETLRIVERVMPSAFVMLNERIAELTARR